jgi:outer membrane protein insertion porin family
MVVSLGTTFSQNTHSEISYENPKDYEIGGIQVVGATNSDETALISISGLEVGDKVKIPSGKIQRAIRSLLKLKLFSDVQIHIEKTIGEVVFLQILVKENARVAEVKIKGIKKNQVEELEGIASNHLIKGTVLTKNNRLNAFNALRGFYLEKGFADVKITTKEKPSKKLENGVKITFDIERGNRVKVQDISFAGNDNVSSNKLRKLLGIKTDKQLFVQSKFVQEELKIGKAAIIAHYNNVGFRDAKIEAEKILRGNSGDWILFFRINEGAPYYFGNIEWKGNSIYSNKDLSKILGIKKGEKFNAEKLNTRLQFSLDGSDVASLYMDNGYLFFNQQIIEKAIRKDTIDLEIRISEGPQATIGKVIIRGNEKTNEQVIRRELYTEPGKKFSRSDIIRSQRALVNLGYFNPEKLGIETKVNEAQGTVDIIYEVEESSSDKFELAGGWSQTGLTGTLGVSFNNFSVKNLFNKDRWGRLPMGDGQQLSLRIQSSGANYQSYNFSFSEPWFGGKKPNSLTFGGFYNRFADSPDAETGIRPTLKILGFSTSLGSRLNWLDGNFVSSTALSFQKYDLNNWNQGLFTTDDGKVVSDGNFYNISINQTLARSTINHPIYPTSGSKFSLSLKFTPPYSLFNKNTENQTDPSQRFKFMEYHKWRFDAEWYTTLTGKLVLKTYGKFGYLGSYNAEIGTSPFERFRVGGHGIDIVQQGFTGVDPISLRGYEISDLENNFVGDVETATSVFNKFGMELRYPISTNPNAMIYGLAFIEGGNTWRSMKNYNPFDIKRSAGVGFRAQLPMFGTIGLDYSIGFDKTGANKWNNMVQLGVILGFEPQ